MENKTKQKFDGLLKQKKDIEKQLSDLYDNTIVKNPQSGDIILDLHGREYLIFRDGWKKQLCYIDISYGGVGYNQLSDTHFFRGLLVRRNGYDYAVNEYIKNGGTLLDTFKETISYEKHVYLHKRFCHWCGQRITTDMVD